MFGFWKDISLFLQIAIVVAGVLLFSFFDPFGLLTFKKQTLEDTPISVRSIKEIGQLITAEYYGEVLTSLQEALLNEAIEEDINNLEEGKNLDTLFRNAIRELYETKGTIRFKRFRQRKKLYDYFYHQYPVLTSHPYYQDYIEVLMRGYGGKKIRNEKRLIKELYDASDIEAELTKVSFNAVAFKNRIESKVGELTGDRKFKKRQIVVLGRGWVKAGIDFGAFNERNFKYDPVDKVVHLIGMKPEILVCTINPWFIPEKQIKGFEVIVATKKARKPRYMQKVKEESLIKLRDKALRADILLQAKRNAEDNLQGFFSLLIPDGVEEVIIHDNFLNYFEISSIGEVISPEIMKRVDSLFLAKYKTDSASIISLKDDLVANANIHVGNKNFPVQRFSSELMRSSDDKLSNQEVSELTSLKESLALNLEAIKSMPYRSEDILIDRLDSIWHYPDGKVMTQLRAKIDQHESVAGKSFNSFQVISGDPKYEAYVKTKGRLLDSLVHLEMLESKLKDLNLILIQLVEAAEQYVAKGDTIFVKSSGSQVDQNIEGTLIKFVNGEELAVQVGIKEALDFDLYSDERVIVTPDRISNLNELLEDLINRDPMRAVSLKENIEENWLVKIGDSTSAPGRYSHLYSNLDTISFEVLKEINQLLDNPHYQLDSLWYSLDPDLLDRFKDQAKKKHSGGLFKKKSKVRRRRAKEYARLVKEEVMRVSRSELNFIHAQLWEEMSILRIDSTFRQKLQGSQFVPPISQDSLNLIKPVEEVSPSS